MIITCCEIGTIKMWEIIIKSYNDNKKRYKIDIKYLNVIEGHKNISRKIIQLKRGNNLKIAK